jgi:hypothetical protein
VRESDGKKSVEQLGELPHSFGRVPLVIFRHAKAPADPIRGLPMHGSVAKASKRLFNLLSELDEHMRGQVFAILVRVVEGEGGNVVLGTDNGLTLAPDAKNAHYFLSPDPGIAETYEKRIEATIRELYRMARVEFARATSTASVSGVARAYEFAQTNRAISDFANELARAEREMDELVWVALGNSVDALAKYTIHTPESFDIEDLQAEMKVAADAITMNLGATMTKRIKMRVAERLEPNMSADLRATVESELDDVQAQQDADAAMARAALDAAGEGDDDPPEPPDDEDEDEAVD